LVVVGIYVGSQLDPDTGSIAETFDALSQELDGGSQTPSNVNDRVTLSGGGDGETRQFTLGGGSYTVRTEVGNDCYYSFTLRDPSDGSRVKSVTSMSDVGSSTVSVHGVDPGTYYIDVITGSAPDCPWDQTWTSS